MHAKEEFNQLPMSTMRSMEQWQIILMKPRKEHEDSVLWGYHWCKGEIYAYSSYCSFQLTPRFMKSHCRSTRTFVEVGSIRWAGELLRTFTHVSAGCPLLFVVASSFQDRSSWVPCCWDLLRPSRMKIWWFCCGSSIRRSGGAQRSELQWSKRTRRSFQHKIPGSISKRSIERWGSFCSHDEEN